LAFQPGEITLIAGGSGSGKTTLIRAINGLIPLAYKEGTLQGDIRCFGESTRGMSLAQIGRRVATVMQDPEKQIVASKVVNELAFGLENLGMAPDEIRARIDAVVHELRIEHLLQRDTHTLSGGERQRVVIAGALAVRPQAILLDEPLAALDPPSARAALELFDELARTGAIVALVEHRVRDVLSVARPDRCVAMSDGAIVFTGAGAAIQTWIGPAPEVVSLAPARQRDAPALLSLMGPNGAGKSTWCRLAIGLNRPQSGAVFVDGRDNAGRTTAEIVRTVGYAFQNPAMTLFANTLRDELLFGPRNIGLDDDSALRNVQQALAIVDLPDLDLARSPFSLSYGQQKRVALAGVLAMRPRVLLMDEPTAGLDEKTAAHMMRALFSAEGRPEAIVMVTHDPRLARRYANRVLLLNDGAIVADGAPGEILDDVEALRRGGLA
jgi:energy-coupling factor transport system ATP-binding protein